MRYVNAAVLAALAWVMTVLVLGLLIGQMFDGIEGSWQIVPTVGIWATSFGIAVLAFRHSLRRSPPRNSN